MRLRSQTLNYAPNSTIVFPLNFLDPARGMRAPVIKNVGLLVKVNCDTGSSGGPARMFPMMFSRIRIMDAGLDRVNLRGSSARIMNQMEFGAAYHDGKDVAAAQTGDTSVSFFLNFPFNPHKSRRRNDYGIPLFELIDGGSIEVSTGAALLKTNYATINTSTTLQLFVDVDDGRTREVKSRLCYRDTDITQTEYNVPIGGALRWFAFYGGEGTLYNQTALTAQNFTSQTLGFSIMPREVFRNGYQLEQVHGVRTADPANTASSGAEDAFYTMEAVALQMVDADQKIPEMPAVASLHVQTDQAITTSNLPKYIFSFIAARDASLSARTVNAASPGQLQDAMAKHGTIKTASGKVSPLSAWPADAIRAMPVKLRVPGNG
jgi:hypothetical protein